MDADNQNHRGPGGQVQSAIPHPELLRQDLPQARLHRLLSRDPLPDHPLAQLLHRLSGGLHSHVRQDQQFLQFLKEGLIILADGGAEQAAQT